MDHASEISVLINAIRDLSQVGICYYDLTDFFHYDKYGIKNNRGHYCAFCEKTRTLPDGRKCCIKSDRQDAVSLAAQYKEPFFFECHMGMKELVVPLLSEGTLHGILFVGQARIREDNYKPTIQRNARRLSGDPEEMLRLYEQLPSISQNDLLNIGKILSVYFSAKVLNSRLLAPETDTQTADKPLGFLMRDYIDANFGYNITPKSVAKTFFVNASYASRHFHQTHGITLTDYIHRVRIQRAKLLLRSTNAPVCNIALNVGYIDPNYFSRIFKKLEGMPPQVYRNTDTE